MLPKSNTAKPWRLALWGLCAVAAPLLGAASATAQVSVTETFNLGVGTRFDKFIDNDLVRPRPGGLDPSENPDDGELIADAFGGQRTFVENGNIVTNRFGFTTTNNAGGSAGEFGGEFNWFDYGAVADTTLGGELNHSQEVVIKAKMHIKDIGPENDQRVTLGYYAAPASPVAADFSRGKISAGISFVGGPRFLLQINGNNSGPINVPFDTTFDIDLTLKFGNDQAWFEGMVNGVEIGDFTYSQAADAVHPFNSFAIAQTFLRENQNAWRRSVVFVDNVTYSVVSDLGPDTPNPVRIDDPGGPGLIGDFDADGNVDGDDFALWRAGFGQATGALLANGDADADGDVDGIDFLAWQRQHGASGGALAAVPEPATGLLALLAAAIIPRKPTHASFPRSAWE